MIVWTAECGKCGAKQKIPNEIRHIDDAKKYAATWQKQHNLEEHNGSTTASEA